MRRGGDRLVGVVLAGGKSSRLGRDKTRLRFHGNTLLGGTVSLLREVVSDVVVAGLDPSGHGVDAPWIPDEVPGLGPAGGLLSALKTFARPCLALSSDLPFIDVPTLRRLLAAREGRPSGTLMTTFRQVETGYLEALTAVYETEAAGPLEDCLARGVYKLTAPFPEAVRRHVDYRCSDPAQARPFFNINSPGDLAAAREMEHVS